MLGKHKCKDPFHSTHYRKLPQKKSIKAQEYAHCLPILGAPVAARRFLAKQAYILSAPQLVVSSPILPCTCRVCAKHLAFRPVFCGAGPRAGAGSALLHKLKQAEQLLNSQSDLIDGRTVELLMSI